MDEKQTANHRVQVINRSQGIITGVVDVISFDLNDIQLETTMGMMQIKGKELHVKRLSLDKGEIEIEGETDSFVYSNLGKYKKSKESLMGRLFK